jgi:hypothetical protein
MELQEERPSYVRFERKAIEDKAASLEAGHYVAKDIDYVFVTPAYSKDVWENKVSTWMDTLKQQLANGRISQEQVNLYKKAYEAWQNGQELPVNGFPIKGWGMISPAQQETLIRMRILTVEDLAQANAEGVSRIGIGGIDLKNKAVAWLSQNKGKGKATLEIAELKKENRNLKTAIASLERKVEELTRTMQPVGIDEPQSFINDLLDDDAA